jgi:hypothetical protein
MADDAYKNASHTSLSAVDATGVGASDDRDVTRHGDRASEQRDGTEQGEEQTLHDGPPRVSAGDIQGLTMLIPANSPVSSRFGRRERSGPPGRNA